MGVVKWAAVVALTAVVVTILPSLFQTQMPVKFGGSVEEKFKKVEQVFKSNFENGNEKQGAAFAVIHKGKLVVDLWGGYSDKYSGRPWLHNTITMVFSTTKAVVALCAAMLVDRGVLDYDKLVTEYWPNFGKHGKDNVTVAMLLSHQAGLAAVDAEITENDVLTDWESMAKKFEDQVPNWPPGRHIGYHAITFGFVVDQLNVMVTNTPEIHGMEIAAMNGIGNARSLAKLLSLLAEGKLVKNREILAKIQQPIAVDIKELVFGLNVSLGLGFMHNKNPQGGYIFGHPGYGGQNAKVDLDNQLSFAYVTNGLTPDMGDNSVNYRILKDALYQCL